MQSLAVRLLGGFEVSVDGAAVPADAWRQRRGADLVKLLALSDGHRLPRERVAEALWPDLQAEAAFSNLHKAATLARRALGERGTIALRGGWVALAPDSTVETDVERFLRGSEPELYGGELLPEDRYEQWTDAPRRQLRSRYLELLRVGGRLEDLVREEPADEAAQRELMGADIAAGKPHGALRRFRRLRDALAEAGLRPGAETLAVHEEVARGPAAAAPLAGGPPLVGRESELRLLEQALDRAAHGRGGAVMFQGEAGIGKTRLGEELLALAARRGWTTLRGGARAGEPRPYGAVAEALDRMLLDRPDLAAELPEPVRGELGRLLVALPAERARQDPRSDRGRLFSAVGQLLVAAARERGAVLFVDDLHDADAAVVDLCAYLAAEAAFEPLLIVLAFRDEGGSQALARMRASLLDRRLGVSVAVSPLGDRAVGALVDAAATCQPSAGTRDAILTRAGGVPFFVCELAAAVAQDGRLTVPGHLYEVVNARLARLDDRVRSHLSLMAALGESFTADELIALTGATEPDAFATLDAALVGEVVAESEGAYRFRHALLREALVRGLGEHRRAAAHRELAERLSASGAPPGHIAHHLVAAGRRADAVPWLSRAATEAAGVAAYADALDLVEVALPHADREQRAELLSLRADLLLSIGDARAPSAYAEALAVSSSGSAVELRVKQARALLAAGDVAVASQLVEGIEAETVADRARLTFVRGMLAWFRGEIEAARRGAEEARPLAVEAGLPMEMEQATQLHAAVAHSLGDWPAGVRADLASTLRLPELAGTFFDAHHCIAEYELAAGPPEPIRMAALSLRDEAKRAGARRARAFAATVAGEAELAAGKPSAAQEGLREAMELAREVGATASEALARARLGEAALADGERDIGRRLLGEATDLARGSAIPHHLLYLVFAARISAAPDRDHACAEVSRGESLLAGAAQCVFCPIGFNVAAAAALGDAGEPERAASYLELAEGSAGLWGASFWPAKIAEARGRIAAGAHERGRAGAFYEEAIDGFAAAGRPLERARVERRLATLRGARPGKVSGRFSS